MARTLPIVSISPSGTAGFPGKLVVAGNYTHIFKGKFYRDAAGAETPFYEEQPAGSTLIRATAFDVIDNETYKGRYTVYTGTGLNDPGVVFEGGVTEIKVVEFVKSAGESGDDVGVGSITNITTYLLSISGESDLIVPPGTALDDRPIELFGKFTESWGEGFAQNLIKLAQNFRGETAPDLPFIGQQWFDTTFGQLRTWTGSAWDNTNGGTIGITHRHEQATPASTWTINHGLNLQAPYIAFVQCFKDIGGGVMKMILPSDVTFVSATQLTVTFSNLETGWVLVKS